MSLSESFVLVLLAHSVWNPSYLSRSYRLDNPNPWIAAALERLVRLLEPRGYVTDPVFYFDPFRDINGEQGPTYSMDQMLGLLTE